jgi:hypothetical protein
MTKAVVAKSPVYQARTSTTQPPDLPLIDLPPIPPADPAATCASQGGVWNHASLVCGPAPPVIDAQTAEQACASSGGTWDPATTSCIPAGGGEAAVLVADTRTLDYPRVHREALGYGYWALDIPSGGESTVLATLGAMQVVPVASGPVGGVSFVELAVATPTADPSAVNAGGWVSAQRAAGLAIVGSIGSDGKPLLCATDDVSVASRITEGNASAAVIFEPSGGWAAGMSPGTKTALYVALGVGGAAAIAGGAYYLTRKKRVTPNPRRRRRRR